MKIESLTSLRFFAAIMVLFSHLDFLARSESKILRKIYTSIFYEGYIGVTFFFILSGFILSYSYSYRIKDKIINTKQFYLGRIARIYPLHLITFVCTLPLVIFSIYNGANISAILATVPPNILLIQSFIPKAEYFFSINAVSWSISNEIFFYLLFPLLILRRNFLLISLSLLIVIFQLLIINNALSPAKQHYYIYIFPISRLLDFIIGIILYRFYIYVNNKNIKINISFNQYASMIILILFFILKKYIPQNYRYDMYYLIPMAYLIFSFAYTGGAISRLLSIKPLVLLGEASFSLYLIHQITINYFLTLNNVAFKFSGIFWDLLSAALILSLSVTLSVLLYKKVEIKITKKVRSFLLKTF